MFEIGKFIAPVQSGRELGTDSLELRPRLSTPPAPGGRDG
jgi:hypothetical protein